MYIAKAALFGTSATLRVGSPYFFLEIITNLSTEVKNATSFKQLKVETWILELRWDTYKPFFVQILEAVSYVIRVSQSKTAMSIGDLSSKTNRTRGIKVSNLEASGHAVSAPKNKLWQFRHFFLFHWYFRDALRRKSLCFFFLEKLRYRQQGNENAITLKQLKVETSNLELRWGQAWKNYHCNWQICN